LQVPDVLLGAIDSVGIEVDPMRWLSAKRVYEALADVAPVSSGNTVIPDTGSTQTR
jgi:hypothetical protein